MTRRYQLLLVTLIWGCGNLPSTTDGVVALEIDIPSPLTLIEGTSRQLTARAFNSQGEQVATDIWWRTPDSTIVVDSATGVVTALAASGVGRVQASAGTLRSDLITFTLQPDPDPEPEPEPEPEPDPDPEPDPET